MPSVITALSRNEASTSGDWTTCGGWKFGGALVSAILLTLYTKFFLVTFSVFGDFFFVFFTFLVCFFEVFFVGFGFFLNFGCFGSVLEESNLVSPGFCVSDVLGLMFSSSGGDSYVSKGVRSLYRVAIMSTGKRKDKAKMKCNKTTLFTFYQYCTL